MIKRIIYLLAAILALMAPAAGAETSSEQEFHSTPALKAMDIGSLDVDITWRRLKVLGPNREGDYVVKAILRLTNNGEAVQNALLRIFVSTDDILDRGWRVQDPSDNDLLLGEMAVPKLKSGETKIVKFKEKGELPTRYAALHFIALVKTANAESQAYSTLLDSGIDLIGAWTYLKVRGVKILGSVSVMNVGAWRPRPFRVQVYHSYDKQLDEGDVPLLAEGRLLRFICKSRLVIFRYEFISPLESGYLILKVDVDDDIKEIDEINNTAVIRMNLT